MSRIRRDTEAPLDIAPDIQGPQPNPQNCRTCQAILEARKEYRPGDTRIPGNHCYGCGTHDASVSAFTDETPCSEDRGKRVCSGCKHPMLVRRATCPHKYAEGFRDGRKCERCELEIQGHRDLFREYMRLIDARSVTL